MRLIAARLRSGGSGHPRQGQPVRVGELPRLRAVQRLERPRRLHARPLPPRASTRADRAPGPPSRRPRTCAPAAVGTETDGSIVCPAGNNLVVGLKPTLGLLSQDGIIPIAHSQDTAGPMAARSLMSRSCSARCCPRPAARGNRLPSAVTRSSCSAARCAASASALTGATSRPTTAANPT